MKKTEKSGGERLGIRDARALALAAGAGFPPRYTAGPDGVVEAVRGLGFVQIDTISVVRRAHEHILWSRVPDDGYAAVPDLEGAGGSERRLVEYWAHAAAYLPIEEWRFCLPRMKRIREGGHEWFRADPEAVARVRDRVAAEGPLSAKDFQEPGRGPRAWWDWKPAKVALEYLFHAGELVCATRKGFQKVYDLAERQIPRAHAGPSPSDEELSERHALRAARSLGIFTKAEAVYQRRDGIDGMDSALEAAVETGALVRARVEGCEDRPYYARADLLDRLRRPAAGAGTGRAWILSPFDPFLIDRKRCARLWDFEYSIECYTPAAKRAFGYFALPLLYAPEDSGEARFAGLVDAKADRRKGTLRVLRLRLASRGSVSPAERSAVSATLAPVKVAALARAAAEEIARFAAFQGTPTVELGLLETDDPRLDRAVRRELARAT